MTFMIESQANASSTPTFLTAAMLRSSREDIGVTRRRSYAENQIYKLYPRSDFGNPRLLSPGEEQKVSTGRQNGKGKGKGKGWRYSWQQKQPQQQRRQGGEGGRGKPWQSYSIKPPEASKLIGPPIFRANEGTPNARTPPNLFPMRESNQTTARKNPKLNNTSPLT